jgi:hypothetical protein
MIDNWFADGCFNFSWYVQADVQFSLIASIIFIEPLHIYSSMDF